MLSVLLVMFQMMAMSVEIMFIVTPSLMSKRMECHLFELQFWSIFVASWFINLNSNFSSLEISFVNNIYTIKSFVLYEA